MRGKFFMRCANLILIVFLLLGFSTLFFAQDKQKDDSKQLREEILSVYEAKGEQGLQDFVKKRKEKISNKFIWNLAESGVKERTEELLRVCEIIAKEKNGEKILADVLFKTGKYFSLISDNKKAFDYFDKAFLLYLKLDDPLGQGNVYLKKGTIYYYIGNISKALDMYDKVLPFFEKAKYTLGKGNLYLRKGDIYLIISENSKALEMYDKALPLFVKARSLIGQGNLYLRKGNIHFIIGELSVSLEMYNKALPFFEKAGDINGQGNIYDSMGEIYLTKGKNIKALEMFDKALPFFKKAKSLIGQGNISKRKGDIYSNLGKKSKALEMYDKALHFFEKAGNSGSQGNIYINKGYIYLNKGETARAIDMFNKAYSFFKEAGLLIGQGNFYLFMGNTYFRIGMHSKALEMYDKAIYFFEKTGNPQNQGNVYLGKGEIYSRIGNNLKAIEMFDKALLFFKKTGEPFGQGNVYVRKGDIYFSTGKNLKAIEMYNKALPFYEKVGEPIGQGNVYLGMGDIYLNISNNSRALDMYDKALTFFEKAGVVASESNALHGKAKILIKLGKKDEALELFEKAITKLEKVRTHTAFSEMKRSFMEKVYKQYEETVLFMLENKYYDKSFKYSESMRGRVFLDQMTEGLVRLEKGLKSELRDERDNLVGKLSALSRQMQETGGKDEKKLKELKEEYHQVESRFEDLLIKIRLENPLYVSVNYLQTVTVRDLQTDVLKKGEILLSYFISPKKAYGFIVSQENFKVKELKFNEKEINGYVERYLHSIKENNTNDVNRFGSKLYEKLLKPLEKYLKKSKEIIIVPAGKLETIPFEPLIVNKKKSGQPVFLLEKYRMKYLQSASLLSILRKHYRRDSDTQSFIGFGDPVYDYENFKQGKPEQGSVKILATESTEITESIFSREDTRSHTKEKRLSSVPSVSSVAIEDEIKEIHRHRYARAGGIMDRLPHSGEEIKTIVRVFEKQSLKSVIHLREQAVEENAKAANMKDFDYIHFSCHGLLSDDFQSLILSQLPPEESKEDGYLTLNEIMNCDYNAKLVVLSACETGSGKMYKGEGVTGLTRAVMYAGTPAVVASLWKVDDIATKELMVKFYRNMLEKNLDKTEALRQAKLELLKKKITHHLSSGAPL